MKTTDGDRNVHLGQKRNRMIVCISWLGGLAILIPLYIIAHFNYPASDDFAYASSIYWGLKNGASLSTIIRDSFATAHRFYMTWQGRYFDDFVCAFGVGIAVPQLYWLGTYLVLTIFVVANITMIRTLTYRICNWDSDVSWICAIWFMMAQVLYVPYAVEAFYWYAGATGYTMTYGLMLLLITTLICFYITKRRWIRRSCALAAVLLAIMVAGSNYAIALLTAELFIVAIAICLVQKRKTFFLYVTFVIYLIGFACNALSPGNSARMNNVESLGVIGSIIASLKQAAVFCKEWFHVPIAVVLVLIVALSFRQVVKMSYTFRLPLLVTLISFGLLASVLTPPFYAGATWGPGRLINIEYYCYYLFLFGNSIYWLGWVTHRKIFAQNFQKSNEKDTPILLCVGIAVVLLVCCLKIYGLQSTSSTSAILSLVKGEAKQYQMENEKRWVLYEDENEKSVNVEDFSIKPHVLYYDDIQADVNDWRNYTVAEFFKKESVKVYSE